MVLDAPTKSLQFALSGSVATNQLSCVASWADMSGSTFTPGSSTAQTNNTTAVTIVAAPGSSVQRQVKNIEIHNDDTANATVKVEYNDNSTLRTLVSITLRPGETLQFAENAWSAIDNVGQAQAATATSGTAGGDLSGTYPNPVVRKASAAFTSGVATLTDASTIAVDASLGNTFTVTLGGNRTMGNPSNATDGQRVIFAVTQDGTGSRTLAWGAAYSFGTGSAPTLTTTAGATDYVGFLYSSAASKWEFLAFVPASGSAGRFVTLGTDETITGRKTFTGHGDNDTGSTGHWLGSVVTNDLTIQPNTDVSSSASMFLDNGVGQVWEFYSDHSGNFGVFDKTGNLQVMNFAPAGGNYAMTFAAKTTLLKGLVTKAFTQTSVGTITLADDDFTTFCNGTTSIQLPTAISNTGRIYTIKQIATGSVTVSTTSSQTIDGASTYSLSAQYKYVTVQSDGSNWFIIANN